MAAPKKTEMEMVLATFGLQVVYLKFQREKITPEIVSMLSPHEFECLGVTNRADIMKLRVACLKYGCSTLQRTSVNGGISEFHVPKSILENLLQVGFKISDISKLLSISERTIYRRMTRYGLSKMNFSFISDNELDIELASIIKDVPLCGENLLGQMLSLRKISVQRWRLRDSVHRVDVNGVKERTKGRLHRRIYNVLCPNDLWHIDTNHKLIRWRFVIIGDIDGFSRMIVFLKCSDNNTSRTVLNCFLTGVEKFGIPNRVRSDKGLENVSVAYYMLAKKGKGGMLTGESLHNQRIERLWRDVFEGILSYYYSLFYHMEDQGILDPFNDAHVEALQYIYLNDINRKLEFWAEAWASHRMRTTKSSPLTMWVSGQIKTPSSIVSEEDLLHYGVEGVIDHPEVEEGGRPIFGPLRHLSDQCKETLEQEVPVARHTLNYGIDSYLKCVEIIERFNF